MTTHEGRIAMFSGAFIALALACFAGSSLAAGATAASEFKGKIAKR